MNAMVLNLNSCCCIERGQWRSSDASGQREARRCERLDQRVRRDGPSRWRRRHRHARRTQRAGSRRLVQPLIVIRHPLARLRVLCCVFTIVLYMFHYFLFRFLSLFVLYVLYIVYNTVESRYKRTH